MKVQILKQFRGAVRWGIFTNLNSRVDRQTLGFCYIFIHTPWRILEIYV